MPWVCRSCQVEPKSQPLPPPRGDAPECQTKKCSGPCEWKVTVASAPTVGPDEAAALGYSVRTNITDEKFPNGHRTNFMFSNDAGTRAISPDGSTHSGGRVGWKAFEKKGTGWNYCGSYDVDLQPWPHRKNDRAGAFPGGND